MKTKNVPSLPEMIREAQEFGVKFIACTMSMDVMGIKPEELIDGLEYRRRGHLFGERRRSECESVYLMIKEML